MSLKRQIIIQTPAGSVDPLTQYYRSSQFSISPLADPSLQTSKESYGSRIRWSLGGWDKDNEDVVLLPEQKDMDLWTIACKNKPEERWQGYDASTLATNPYLVYEPSSDGNPDNANVLRLPAVFSKLRADTIEKVLSQFRDEISERLLPLQTYRAGELTEESRSFYGSILAKAKTGEPLYDHAYRMIRFRDENRRIQAALSEAQDKIDFFKQKKADFLEEGNQALADDAQENINIHNYEVANLRAELETFGSVRYPNLDTSFRFGIMYVFAGLGADIYQDKIALYNAVKSILGEEFILSLMTKPPDDKKTVYKLLNVSTEAPFVTRAETHSYIDSRSSAQTDQGVSQIMPEYLFYDRNYEKAINGPDVPEKVQPNMYVYDLYTSAITNNRRMRVSPDWQGDPSVGNRLQNVYATLVRLAGHIPYDPRLLNDTSLRDYLDSFAYVATCVLPEETKIVISRQYESIIFPATEIDLANKTEEKKKFFPMYIQTSFGTSEQGKIGKIIEDNKVSTCVMEYLQKSDLLRRENNVPEVVEQEYSIRTDFLTTQGSRMVKRSTGLGNKAIKTTDIFRALKYGVNNVPIFSAVMSEKGEEPITYIPLTNSQKQSLARAGTNVRSVVKSKTLNYFDYLSNWSMSLYPGEHRSGTSASPHETLGYKLSKFNEDGIKIQDILFANSGPPKTINYVDTQVKYDTKYTYKLSEFLLVIGTQCELLVVDASEPTALLNPNKEEIPDVMPPKEVFYDIRSYEKPVVEILEVPIYDGEFYEHLIRGTSTSQQPSVAYPEVNIMSHPPCAPDLQILPLLNNYKQIKINTQLGTGNYTGDHALKVINIGQNQEKILSLFQYQKQFENYDLKPGHLEYKNEGTEEIRKVTLLRTQQLDLTVPNYDDLYSSFGLERVLSIDPEENVETVVSYDVLDTLEPNTYYYYTCFVEDNHGNPSLPSPIYRVRLVYEKGLFIPEIELFQYTPISNQMPTRRFARFMRVEASDIQTSPFFDINEDGNFEGTKNLASVNGSSVIGNTFVLRLTSRDTGRKFDIKLTFDEKAPVEEDENTPCND